MAKKAKKKKTSAPRPEKTPVATTSWHMRTSLVAGILFVLSFLLYANTLGHGFVLDDAIVITDNFLVQQGVSGWGELFSYDTFYGFFRDESKAQLVSGGRYRPLTLAMFSLEQSLSSGPFIHHFFNLLWYGLTVVLLYWLLTSIVRHRYGEKQAGWAWLPLLAAAFFAVHPIHTEVVANIKGRDEIIATLGSLGATFLIWRSVDKSSWLPALLAAGVFFLGLLAKENTITFLAVIPLAVFAFRRDFRWGQLRYVLPLLIVTAVFLYVRWRVIGTPSSASVDELMNNPFLQLLGNEWVPFSFGEWSATVVYSLGKYLQLLLFPISLSHDYYPRAIDVMGWGDGLVWLALLANVVLLITGVLQLRRRPWVGFGILVYFATLSIVSNVFFSVGTNLSERFLFMPSMGYAILLAWGVLFLAARSAGKAGELEEAGDKEKAKSTSSAALPGLTSTQVVKWPLIIAGAVLLLYGGRTLARNPVWENNYSLFTTDVESQPNSAKLQNAAAGVKIDYYQSLPESSRPNRRELLSEARSHLNRALEIHPTYKNAYLLRGNAQLLLGEYEAAVTDYELALELDPGYEAASDNLLAALVEGGRFFGEQRGDLNTSRNYLERALSMAPNNYQTLRLLGVLNGVGGNNEGAIAYFERAAAVAPDRADAWWDLGTAYYQSGQIDLANVQFEKARAIEPGIDQRKASRQ